ncbi:NAD-dependent epimerase/dehydratase family protein [Phytohabitans rumicis]|uniref:NAD-dependent epimerase/dehydratase domain-containing protein n=1 Tax=Phytohabitans rumicis TaxID=1076125 RepID=A0A6V8L908_9ACTN|nr:NAD-dependent epimerase/dehydratase family protein [Phytohabitans rumicis]GFJ89175.1 hypothetical protein Prum_028170 [Phytohabitans rumicis]
MTRLLVFGASGFLGEQVCRALTADERVTQVIAAGRRSPAVGVPRVQHDLVTGSAGQLADLLASTRVDAVVNCAGRLAGTPAELLATNTAAVATLIEAVQTIDARRPPERPLRLVSFGSAAEYGVVERGRPVRETDCARPVSAYGVTKLAATRLVEVAAAGGRLDGIVLRVFNPVGPGLPAENVAGRAVREIRDALAEGTSRIRLGPLGAYRDFVDVRDVAAAVVAAVFAARPAEVVCNMGSGTRCPPGR